MKLESLGACIGMVNQEPFPADVVPVDADPAGVDVVEARDQPPCEGFLLPLGSGKDGRLPTFHDAIQANLRCSAPEATDEQVEAAARAANIHNFVASLPKDYETVVGERGYRLSGGEKQRVAIAWAPLKDPGILILDEATSSVDAATERAIQDALERLTRGRPVLAIAHRLSTVLKADLIVVLDHRSVVERGALGCVYANLYHHQFATERVAVAK